MDIVQYISPQIIWAHHMIAPWGGWLLGGLILALGFRWFYRTLRRAGRSVTRTANNWFGRRRVLNELAFRHQTSQEIFESCATPGLIEPDPRSR